MKKLLLITLASTFFATNVTHARRVTTSFDFIYLVDTYPKVDPFIKRYVLMHNALFVHQFLNEVPSPFGRVDQYPGYAFSSGGLGNMNDNDKENFALYINGPYTYPLKKFSNGWEDFYGQKLLGMTTDKIASYENKFLGVTVIKEAIQVIIDPVYLSKDEQFSLPITLTAHYEDKAERKTNKSYPIDTESALPSSATQDEILLNKAFKSATDLEKVAGTTIRLSGKTISVPKNIVKLPKVLRVIPLWEAIKIFGYPNNNAIAGRLTKIVASVNGTDIVKTMTISSDNLHDITREIVVTSPYDFTIYPVIIAKPESKPFLFTIEEKDVKESLRLTFNNLINAPLSITYFYQGGITTTEKIGALAAQYLGRRLWKPTLEKVIIQATFPNPATKKQPLIKERTITKEEILKYFLTEGITINDQLPISITIDNQSDTDIAIEPINSNYNTKETTTKKDVPGITKTTLGIVKNIVEKKKKSTLIVTTPAPILGKDYSILVEGEYETVIKTLKESTVEKIKEIVIKAASKDYCETAKKTISIPEMNNLFVEQLDFKDAQGKPNYAEINLTITDVSSDEENLYAASCTDLNFVEIPNPSSKK